ncbi:hypothetical protein O181_012522 [Austropuccinia psidii MF-1]|uniref:PH domain-containing protein n=1 Tax=Austropuccinia psidii MF-1 TaxID=1389203 RepID=A0A9Q3BWL2_9BASI|nr:hypothetical protein [Austropuccinia psidii MF-1]
MSIHQDHQIIKRSSSNRSINSSTDQSSSTSLNQTSSHSSLPTSSYLINSNHSITSSTNLTSPPKDLISSPNHFDQSNYSPIIPNQTDHSNLNQFNPSIHSFPSPSINQIIKSNSFNQKNLKFKMNPSFKLSSGEDKIEELLETLGYGSSSKSLSKSSLSKNDSIKSIKNSTPSIPPQNLQIDSRNPIIMLDNQGREFSIHEHSLSPVTERTELDTSSNLSINQNQKPSSIHKLIPIQSTQPLSFSPKSKLHHHNRSLSPTFTRSSSNNSLNLKQTFNQIQSNLQIPQSGSSNDLLSPPNSHPKSSRPSLHRIPKRTTQLIQLFEGAGSSSTPTFTLPPSNSSGSNQNSKSTFKLKSSSPSQLPSRSNLPYSSNLNLKSIQTSSSTSPKLQPIDKSNSLKLPDLSQLEKDRIRLRNERRQRTELAKKGLIKSNPPTSPIQSDKSSLFKINSPMSDKPLKHRLSISSSITSNLTEPQILHSGSIWYRNPQVKQWKETHGILTAEALYLLNQNGQIDHSSPNQSIELVLRGCTSVESVRSKRSFGPDFNEPHLHMLRIAWAEFDQKTNSRIEHEEFLGCSRATQRADWVGALWQAAHDLGGFIDQPDIPLVGKPITSTQNQPQTQLINHQPLLATSIPSVPSFHPSSPTLNPVSLVDRSMSIVIAQNSQSNPTSNPSTFFPNLSHLPLSQPISTSHSSALSSNSNSDISLPTTNLISELDRDLNNPQQIVGQSSTQPSPTRHLYHSDQQNNNLTSSLIDINDLDFSSNNHSSLHPNPNQKPIESNSSPELDIFAMLDRMSVKGSIHKNTAQFYDPPSVINQSQSNPSQDIYNPQPVNLPQNADLRAMEDNLDNPPRTSSRLSSHTIRPPSVPEVRQNTLDSSNLSSIPSINLDPQNPIKLSIESSQTCPTSTKTQNHQNPSTLAPTQSQSPLKGRGAWSDIERISNQTDNLLTGPAPTRAVQRDLRRILKTIERNDSRRAEASESLGHYLDSIHHQLQNVAAKLRGHEHEREPNHPVTEGDEPTIADKVDYMLSLCNVLLESQHKVSSAVEKNLLAHGVSISRRSAANTRSLTSDFNNSRQSSHLSFSSGMPGPAPLTPLPEASLDEVQKALSTHPDSSQHILTNSTEPEQLHQVTDDVRPPPPPTSEDLPPVAVQEAGLGRIENLLVALLSRMDDVAQRQQESSTLNENKHVPELGIKSSRALSIRSDAPSSMPDLDADVALWKARAKGVGLDENHTSQDNHANPCTAPSSTPTISTPLNSVYAPTEPEISPGSSDQVNYQAIPDYNLAYEAEDEVARRIADERARAARKLEGLSTPFGYRQSVGQNTYPQTFNSNIHERGGVELASAIPPNQDPAIDSHRRSTQNMMLSRNPIGEHSYWSSTTPSAGDQPSASMPLPFKEQMIKSPPPRQVTPSIRSSNSRPASTIASRQTTVKAPSMVSPPPPVSAPPVLVQQQLLPEELRGVFEEVLKNHSSEQVPILDEMVTILRNQDQVNQASILNQAEVSRYLGQLNVHLEGVLQKKNGEIEQIGDNVARLEKQLSSLLEQSEKISSTLPLLQNIVKSTVPPVITQSIPPPEQVPPTNDQPCESGENLETGIQLETGDCDQAGQVDVSVPVAEEEEVNPVTEAAEPSTSGMTKKPSAAFRIGGPRARQISFGKGLKGPRVPAGLATVGKLWGGPTPAADRAARWGTGGGSLKRTPTKMSHLTTNGVNVEGALAGVNTEEPAGQEALKPMNDGDLDDKTGTIALGVSHILKFLRENSEKEEARRQKKEVEKAAMPKPAIPNEMEERRLKIEELQLRREATLAEDKAKNMEAMMQAMKQQAAEHDKLLKKMSEELQSKKSKDANDEEIERQKRYDEAMEGVQRVLTTIESGVLTHLEDFKSQMFHEMKQTFEKVGELREQKQQIQSDLADLMSFMSKVRGGGPDPRWQYPSPIGSVHNGGSGGVGSIDGSVAGGQYHNLNPIPQNYPSPQIDHQHHPILEREGTEIESGILNKSGFGPRPPPPASVLSGRR